MTRRINIRCIAAAVATVVVVTSIGDCPCLQRGLSPQVKLAPASRFENTGEVKLGARFGKYEILYKLGKGGMGKVYVTQDTSSGKTVALKVISADLAGNAESVRKFKQEGEIQKKLKHPSVPEVYETGEINGTPFMAMQYIRGRALNNIISENRPDIRTALAITEKIARALDDLHKQGIIHLDIKPGNILVDHEGNIYILDFGLTMALTEKGGFIETGRIIGTPGYLSPQSIEGSIDRRTDIYSLGVVLYEMLAGRLPFVGGNNEDVLRQTYDDNPLPPRYFNPEIPEGVEAIVLKAISKDPYNRYQSAGEFADAIHSYLNGSRAALALSIEQIPEKMPAKELLRALELDKAEVIKTEPGPNGLTINTIRIPHRLYVDKPPQGLEILHNELAPTRDFELLINAKGYVIAVFPAITEKLRRELDRTGYFYFDLSSYYFEVPKIGDPDAKMKWQEFCKRREADKSAIAAYKKARQIPDELEDISQTTHPYVYVELDKGTGLIKTIPFGSQGFDGNFIVKPDVHQAILPIFPTVYGVSEHEYGTDKGFLSFIYRGRANGRGQLFGLEKGSSVLVMGPGSGIDTWVASLITQTKVYAAGINPLEVANVRAFAKIAGFEVEAKIHDNIITDNGTPVFPQKFDRVIWNMPAYIDVSWREERLSRHLSMYWDGDMHGMTLKRFALGLPAVLKSTGRGLVWNMPTYLFPRNRHTDIVEEIFRSAAKPLDVVRLSVEGTPVPFYLISVNEAARTSMLAPGSRFEDEAEKFKAAGMKPSMINKLVRRGISFERADSLRKEGRLPWYWVTWYFTVYKEDPEDEWRKHQGLRDRLVKEGELPLSLATRLVSCWKDADSEWRKKKKLRQRLLKDKTLNRRNATFLVLRYVDPIAAWKTKRKIRNELHKKEGLTLNQATEIVLAWKDAEKEWYEVRRPIRDEIFKAGGISPTDATEAVIRWGNPKKEWETRKTIRDNLIKEGGLSKTRANSIVLRWGGDVEGEWKSRRAIRDELVEKFDIPEYFATTLVLGWENPKSAINDMRRDAKEIVRQTGISEARAMGFVLKTAEPLQKLDDLEESLKIWGLSITEYAAIFYDLRYDTARIYAIWKVCADSGEIVNPEGLRALHAFKQDAGKGTGEAIVEFRQPGEALFIGNSVMVYWVPGLPNKRSQIATFLVDCGESLSLIKQDRFRRRQGFGRHGFGARIPEGRMTKREFKFRKDLHKFEPQGQQVPLRQGDRLLVGENIVLHLQGLTEKGLSIKLTAPVGAELAQGRQRLERVVIKDIPISWSSARWVGVEEAKRLLIKQVMDIKGCNDKDAHEEIAFEAKANKDGFFTFSHGRDAKGDSFTVSLWTRAPEEGPVKIRRYHDEDLGCFIFETRRVLGGKTVIATSIIKYNDEKKMNGTIDCDRVKEVFKCQLLSPDDQDDKTKRKDFGSFEVVVPEGGKYLVSSGEGLKAHLATGSPKSGKVLVAIEYDLKRKCRVFKTERVVDGKLIATTSIRQRVLEKGVNAFIQIENKVVDFGEAELKQRFKPQQGPRIVEAGAEHAKRVYDEVDRLVDIDTAQLARTTFYIELFKAQKEKGRLSEKEKRALANKMIRRFVGEVLGKEFADEFKDDDGALTSRTQVKAIRASGAIELRAELARGA